MSATLEVRPVGAHPDASQYPGTTQRPASGAPAAAAQNPYDLLMQWATQADLPRQVLTIAWVTLLLFLLARRLLVRRAPAAPLAPTAGAPGSDARKLQ